MPASQSSSDTSKPSRRRPPCPPPRTELVHFKDALVHPDYIPLARRTCAARTLDITFQGEINDMRIPGLFVDWDKMMVTCDWRTLMIAFFKEEWEVERRFKEEKRLRQAAGVPSSPLWIGIGAGGMRNATAKRSTEDILEASVYEVVRNERLARLGWRDDAGHERLHRKRIALRYRAKHDLPIEPQPPPDDEIPAIRLASSHGSNFLHPGSSFGGMSPGTSPTTTYVGSMPNTHPFPSDSAPSPGYLGRDKRRISNKRVSTDSRSRKTHTEFTTTPSSHM